MLTVIAALTGLLVGAALAAGLLLLRSDSRVRMAARQAETIRREGQIEAREQAVRLRGEIEQEIADRRTEIAKIDERAQAAEQEVARRDEEISRREQGLSDRETHVRQLQEELKAAKDEAVKELERISGFTVVEAKAHLLERSEDLIRHELARTARQLEEEARGEARRRARSSTSKRHFRPRGSSTCA